jgi:hypothetical protein
MRNTAQGLVMKKIGAEVLWTLFCAVASLVLFVGLNPWQKDVHPSDYILVEVVDEFTFHRPTETLNVPMAYGSFSKPGAPPVVKISDPVTELEQLQLVHQGIDVTQFLNPMGDKKFALFRLKNAGNWIWLDPKSSGLVKKVRKEGPRLPHSHSSAK